MKNLEKVSEQLTVWIGTPSSIIIHTILFIGIFSLRFFELSMDNILLILTTAVSLEAIYLAIFIQMSVNRTSKSLTGVEKDIDDIQEDIDDIQEDVEGLEMDVKELNEDEEDEDDEVIKEIKDIESRIAKLHEIVIEIHKKNLK